MSQHNNNNNHNKNNQYEDYNNNNNYNNRISNIDNNNHSRNNSLSNLGGSNINPHNSSLIGLGVGSSSSSSSSNLQLPRLNDVLRAAEGGSSMNSESNRSLDSNQDPRLNNMNNNRLDESNSSSSRSPYTSYPAYSTPPVPAYDSTPPLARHNSLPYPTHLPPLTLPTVHHLIPPVQPPTILRQEYLTQPQPYPNYRRVSYGDTSTQSNPSSTSGGTNANLKFPNTTGERPYSFDRERDLSPPRTSSSGSGAGSRPTTGISQGTSNIGASSSGTKSPYTIGSTGNFLPYPMASNTSNSLPNSTSYAINPFPPLLQQQSLGSQSPVPSPHIHPLLQQSSHSHLSNHQQQQHTTHIPAQHHNHLITNLPSPLPHQLQQQQQQQHSLNQQQQQQQQHQQLYNTLNRSSPLNPISDSMSHSGNGGGESDIGWGSNNIRVDDREGNRPGTGLHQQLGPMTPAILNVTLGKGGRQEGPGKKEQIKRYMCEVPGCGRAFARSFNLQNHVKTHQGIREFDCPECPKQFSRRHDCQRHCITVHHYAKGTPPVKRNGTGANLMSMNFDDDPYNQNGIGNSRDLDLGPSDPYMQ